MSQSIDFRINDFINEYLDYKGFSETVEIFQKERTNRQEPIRIIKNSNNKQESPVQMEMLKHFDEGNRHEYFRLWNQHVPSNIVTSDSSLTSLEFLLHAHFAVYHLRPNCPNKSEELANENMQIFKSYMESIKGQAISQTNEILPLFALPYVSSPDKRETFQEIFSNEWLVQLRKKMLNFFDWIFSNRPLPHLVTLFQNGERASHVLTQLNNENEELKFRNRETNRQIKHLSTDYCNLISITMELVETLQQAIVGKSITNEYIDNVCGRLGLARLRESVPDTTRVEIDDPFIEKFDYGKIKRDIVNVTTNQRQKSLLLQALRWKLTKAKTDFKREKMLECYVGCDLLGCRTDSEQKSKVIKEVSSVADNVQANQVKEQWARFINTIASLRKGRNYLAPNEQLIIYMQKITIGESSDTPIRQHLLAALQKLSLRRSVQNVMINQNMIKWLVQFLSKTEHISDYTLEYGVALLMNLCLHTNGRQKCAEIADQAISLLSSLLTHPNQETRPYVNSSLYSMLTLKSIREKAMAMKLDDRLRSLIRLDSTNAETKGQLEFLLNLLSKGGDQTIDHSTDDEQDNDEEDQDIMENDLDLADKLQPYESELGGDDLMKQKYALAEQTRMSFIQKPYNNILYVSSVSDVKSRSLIDPVLHRPITPGQLRQSTVAHTVDSLASSFAVGDMFQNSNNMKQHSNGHHPTVLDSTTSFFSKVSPSTNISIVSTSKSSVKLSKTSTSIVRPKSSQRPSTSEQKKQTTPVLAFQNNDSLEHSIQTIIPTTKGTTPPMKFSYSEPPRSNSSASIRSSSSSTVTTLEISHGNPSQQKNRKS